MKYREFKSWCNDRAFDGRWGMKEAIICIEIIQEIEIMPFWKRNKRWKELEKDVVTLLIEPINKKIKEVFKQ